MKNIVIFGITHFAKYMKFFIEKEDIYNRQVVAFTASELYIDTNSFCDLPVVPFESLEEYYPPDKYDILLAIGDREMNDIRKTFFYKCKEKGYFIASYIHPSCEINSSNLGEGNILLYGCYIDPFSKLGKGNLLWNNVTIAHDCSVGDFNTFSGHADMCGFVSVGNNCYIGKRSLINDYVEIDDYSYIGAMAYVKTNTKQFSVVAAPRSEIVQKIRSIDFVRVIESMQKQQKKGKE